MGSFCKVVCPSCGYEFEALYWLGRSDEPLQKAMERLKSKARDDLVTREYLRMKQLGPVDVEVDFQPFLCRECRAFFNHNRVILRGSNREYYMEKTGICPSCGKEASIQDRLELNQMEGKGENGYGECKCLCPKCAHPLKVVSSGMFD